MTSRRRFIQTTAALAASATIPCIAHAQQLAAYSDDAVSAVANHFLRSIAIRNYSLFVVLCEFDTYANSRPMPRLYGDMCHAAKVLTYHLARPADTLARADMHPIEKMQAFDTAAGIAWYKTKWIETLMPRALVYSFIESYIAPFAKTATYAQDLAALLEDEETSLSTLPYVAYFEIDVPREKKKAMLEEIAARKAERPGDLVFKPYTFEEYWRERIA
jgi:hypothetical protein